MYLVFLFLSFRTALTPHPRHKAGRGAAEVTVTPEYGPPPYQSAAAADESGNALWRMTLLANDHVRAEYESWRADALSADAPRKDAPPS